MISDLDETIKQLLVKKGKLDPAEVDISFDMPDREWSASISKPTINVYLYDIQENIERRDNDWCITSDGTIATKTKAPVRVNLSYLVTAWTSDTADQHRLLSHVFITLYRHAEFPDDIRAGRLKGTDWPILTETGQPNGVLRNTSDFWSALDNQLKPSINYVVTLPIDLDIAFSAPEVKTKVFKFGDRDSASLEEAVQINGTIRRKGKPDQVVSDAIVAVKELRMTAKTDEEGKYAFRKVRFGDFTFEIALPGEQKKREVAIAVPSANYDIEL